MHALLEKSIENSINVIFQGFNEISWTVQYSIPVKVCISYTVSQQRYTVPLSRFADPNFFFPDPTFIFMRIRFLICSK